jgi:hypothetical protein
MSTGRVTGVAVSRDTATLRGTANITRLGAGSNVPFSFEVHHKGGPGARSVLKVATFSAPFNEILLEGKSRFRQVKQVFNTYGSYLLSLADPKGCPTHTSYPAGDAVIAGACVTVLKAVFGESFVILHPVVASMACRCFFILGLLSP